jgi:hypothetical protein
MLVSVGQRESRPVCLDGAAELLARLDPVHRQSRLVGPANPLVRLDQDHAFAQPCDDLLKMAMRSDLVGNAGIDDGTCSRNPAIRRSSFAGPHSPAKNRCN